MIYGTTKPVNSQKINIHTVLHANIHTYTQYTDRQTRRQALWHTGRQRDIKAERKTNRTAQIQKNRKDRKQKDRKQRSTHLNFTVKMPQKSHIFILVCLLMLIKTAQDKNVRVLRIIRL